MGFACYREIAKDGIDNSSLSIKSEFVKNVRDQAAPSLVRSTADKGLRSVSTTEFA